VDRQFLDKLKETFKGNVILFPYAVHGNMLCYVDKVKGLPEDVVRFYLRQVISALRYVQTKTGKLHPNLSL
jgi:hypothetical protein